jgi:RNA polymerase primary sigma factor
MLSYYFNEIKKYPPLSREDEHLLAVAAKAGDRKAYEDLMNANLRFVFQVAKEYLQRGLDFEDLIAEGNVGMLKAFEKYDPHRGIKFISYAVWWIRQSIINALHKYVLTVKLPLSKMINLNKIASLQKAMAAELDRDPSPQELASILDDPSILEDLQYVYTYIYLDDTGALEEGHSSLHDAISEEDLIDYTDPLDGFEEEFVIAVSKLKPREARILSLYYGIGELRPYTLREIGVELNLTRERIRQLKDASIEKLKRQQISQRLKDYL